MPMNEPNYYMIFVLQPNVKS